MSRTPEGRPIVRRFVIKRFPLAILSRSPWIVRDRQRPAWLGHARSHAAAIKVVDRILERERIADMHRGEALTYEEANGVKA